MGEYTYMVDKNPYEKILEQVADLLVMVNKNQGKILDGEELPADIEKQLEDLENDISLFKKITDEALKKCGATDEELLRRIHNPSEISNRKDKRVVKRAGRLREELEQMESGLSMYVRAAKMNKKSSGKKGRSRKSKFKRLGGDDKGWMPL